MTQRTIKQSPKTGIITHAEAKRAVEAVCGDGEESECYLVQLDVRWEGPTPIAVHSDKAQAIGLKNRLNKRCDTSWGKYSVTPIPLNPDPVETTKSRGEKEVYL